MPGEGQRSDGRLDQPATRARFAATVKARRLAKGLTQNHVAHWSGLDVAEVSRLERGVREPKLWTIVRLARGLGVEPADLLEDVR
jgi:transcriptional regulator with XRE-family HTH domain